LKSYINALWLNKPFLALKRHAHEPSIEKPDFETAHRKDKQITTKRIDTAQFFVIRTNSIMDTTYWQTDSAQIGRRTQHGRPLIPIET